MTEPLSPPRRRLRPLVLGLSLLLLAPGCVPSATRPAPSEPPAQPTRRAPPTEEELAARAELLALEDRRVLDMEALTRLSAHGAPAIRARAALTLGRLLDPSGGQLLLRLLADEDTSVAATAAFSLGQLGDSTHAGALARHLNRSAAPTVSAEAAYALGKVGGSVAQLALRDLLASVPVAGAGNRATAAVGSALLAIWKLPRLTDPDPVVRWLGAEDPALRWRAAYALSRRPDRRAVTELQRALTDGDARVRAQAVRGLPASAVDSAGVDRSGVVEAVTGLLSDSSYQVAVNAVRVLGSYSDVGAVEALVEVAADSAHHRAWAALESLGRIGADALSAAPLLRDIVLAGSRPVALRAAALESLVRVDSSASIPLAADFARASDWRLRASAARAQALLVEPMDARLLDGVRDADHRVAGAALQALVEASADDLSRLRPLLVEQLGSPDPIVRSVALGGLARFADPSLLPVLLDAYGRARADTLNDAALAALDALGALPDSATAPERAFFARFPRSPDHLVRRRALARLESTAVESAWGEALPVETARSTQEYRALVDRLVAPALRGDTLPEVMIITVGGTITLRLYADDAPLTVESFLTLADRGYFDGQEWPRVVPNFVVQGGDPRGDTSGGPGYTIRDEINRHRYGRGTVGMALAGPDTGGSQFFFTHSPQPHLDGTYTVFGEVVAGQELAQRLLPGDPIVSIRSMR